MNTAEKKDALNVLSEMQYLKTDFYLIGLHFLKDLVAASCGVTALAQETKSMITKT